MTDEQKARVHLLLVDYVSEHGAVEVHHGDCMGADADFHDLADNECLDIVIHPPIDDSKRAFCSSSDVREPKPYLDRNHDIVNETRVLIACPNGRESPRSGTWATVRYARNRIYQGEQQLTYIITPSGEIRKEGR
jgi:hypothetical protein